MIKVPKGSTAQLEVDFTSEGQPVDPDIVHLWVTDPTSVTQDRTDTIEHDPAQVGHYQAEVDVLTAGAWYFRWETTGAGQSVVEGYLWVAPSLMDPPLPIAMPPDPAQVRAESTVDYEAEGVDDVDYVARMREATGLVESLTGRTLDATLAAGLRPLALRAVRMKTEKVVVLGTTKARVQGSTSGRLRSFTAGPYSETYFGPQDAAAVKTLDPDPELNEVLWALATDDMRDYWTYLWHGTVRPAATIQSFDFGLAPGGYRLPRVGPGVPGYPPSGWE